MPSNNIQTLSPEGLVALATQVKAGIGTATPNPYGVATATVDGLGIVTTQLAAANAAVVAARAAYRAAVDAREAKRGACAISLAGIARTVYANAAVSPSMVSALGLSPRSGSRTRVTPQSPLGLVAEPSANGTVRLRWARGGNPEGVVFLVEAQGPDGAWRIEEGTTRAALTLDGFAPGEPAAFRVVATKNGRRSAPSGAATIYPAAPSGPMLRLAA